MAETTQPNNPTPNDPTDTSLADAYDPALGALHLHVGPGPLPEEGDSKNPTPPNPAQGAADPAMRHLYAKSLMDGEVSGPDEFARYTAPGVPETAAQYPSIKHFIDGSIDALSGSGADLTLESMGDTRENLANLWALSGDNQLTLQTQIENDPLMQEALGQPGAISSNPHDPEREKAAFEELGNRLEDFKNSIVKGWEDAAKADEQEAEGKPLSQRALDPKEMQKAMDVALSFGPGVIGEGKVAALFKLPEHVAPVVSDIEARLHEMQGKLLAQRGTVMKNMQKPEMQELIGDGEKQARIRDDIEQRLIDPKHAHSEETNQFLAAIRPLTEREHSRAIQIAGLLTPEEAEKMGYALGDIKSVDQGYAHRIEKVKSKRQRQILAPGQTPANMAEGVFHRTLSIFAPGLKARNWYVLETRLADGTRVRTPAARGIPEQATVTRNGAYVHDPATGKRWEVRPATVKEIEANSKIKYHDNYLAGLLTNVDNLNAVYEHLKFLKNLVPELEAKGLFVKRSPQRGMPPARAEGMTEVNLPQMKGWAEPHIAAVLNRFWNEANPSNFRQMLHAINTALVQAMFVTPIPHMFNVATSWAVGRGWQWLNPRGYWPAVLDGARALRAVREMNVDWVRLMRAGAGLASPRTELGNYHAVLMEKLFNEQQANPRLWGSFARSLGIDKLDTLIQAELKWSHKTLWRANDVFLMQRIFEFERRGLPLEQAIERAERDIPTYRLPTHILGSAKLSDLLSDNSMVMFGRYHYGLLRSLSLMVRDLIGPQATMQDRLDAAGKWVVLGALTYLWPQQLRPSGPEAISNAARNLWTTGEQKWHAFTSSLLGAGVAWDIAETIRSGKDNLGRPIWRGDTQQKIEHVIETAIGYTYPGEVLLQILKHPQGFEAGLEQALGSLANLKISQPKHKQRHQSSNHMLHDHDPIDRWVREHLRKAGML